MKLCELGSVSESERVQRLHRLSILCNSRVPTGLFLPVSGTFSSSEHIHYPTMRVRPCLLNILPIFEWYVWK